MTKHAIGGAPFLQNQRAAHGFLGPEDQLCQQSHYAAIVDAQKDVEIYHLGDVGCPDCLRRMAAKQPALAEVFRSRLVALLGSDVSRCRIYDTACVNPSYCSTRDACCAGDSDCVPSAKHEEAP